MKNKEVGPISSIVDGRRKRNRCKCIGDDPPTPINILDCLKRKKERKKEEADFFFLQAWSLGCVGESYSILFLYSIIIEEEAELDLGT